MSHACQYAVELRWGAWEAHGPLRERVAWQLPVCTTCGREQPARRPRRPAQLQAESAVHETTPDPDATARKVAACVLQRTRLKAVAPARGLVGALAGRGVPASLVEEWLHRFLRSGWVSLTWRLRGTRRTLASVRACDPAALAEFVRPGERARRLAALEAARTTVAGLAHPVGAEVARLLAAESAGGYPPGLIRALAQVALHADSGDVLPARVFSAHRLGDSKALGRLRPRLERLLGRLDALGIREGAAVALVGGQGRIRIGGQTLDLDSLRPFVGLARETLQAVESIEFPRAGVFVVENLVPFEACCRGEIETARDALVVWAAGYPGRAVRSVIERAARDGVRVRTWADLDLDGVRIARLVASWCPAVFEPYGMSPADVAAAPAVRPLSTRSAAAIRTDVAERPEALLADTLRALLSAGIWVEQEAFLAR